MTARRPRTVPSDLARDIPEKASSVNGLDPYVVGAWEPPSEADRERVRDGLVRHGAHDLAEILGLIGPPLETGPLTVGCPTCGSAVGAACRDSGGRDRYRGTHRARLEAA